MDHVETTVELFGSGMNCAQAILTAFGAKYGLDATSASRLGRPLGGGMGHLAGTCGALTAASLVLGLTVEREEEGESRRVTHQRVQELVRRFEAIHGTSECRELLGADMSTRVGMKKIDEEKLVPAYCPDFVRDAARILNDLLAR